MQHLLFLSHIFAKCLAELKIKDALITHQTFFDK